MAKAEPGPQRTPLHRAAKAGDLEAVEGLLRDGAVVDAVDENGGTALLEAVDAGHAKVVAALLAAGADPSFEGGAVQEILGDHARPWVERGMPLHYAARAGHAEIVALLLAAGADVHGTDAAVTDAPLLWALSSESGWTRGHVDVVGRLLAAGAHAGARSFEGDTALHLAVAGSSVAIAKMLLRHGADVNARNAGGAAPIDALRDDPTFDNRDRLEGETRKLAPMLALLGDAGAELDIASLIWAGDAPRIERWIAGGGDPSSTIVIGSVFQGEPWPILLVAAYKGHHRTVALLRARGADPTATTGGGMTLLECAAAGGMSDLVVELAAAAPGHLVARAVVAAARAGAIETLERLLERAPDLRGHRPIDAALRSRAALPVKTRAIERLIASGARVDAATLALLDPPARGAVPKYRERRIRTDDDERAALLAILSSNLDSTAVDPNGLLPQLWRAIHKKRAGEVRALVAAGADLVRGRDPKWGEPALGVAVGVASPEIVRVLLEAGADANACGESGTTALHQAASYGQLEIVELPLAHGADPTRVTPEGKTALDLAADEPVRERLAR